MSSGSEDIESTLKAAESVLGQRRGHVVLLELGFKYSPDADTLPKREAYASRIHGIVGRVDGLNIPDSANEKPFLDLHYHLCIKDESEPDDIRRRLENFFEKDLPYICRKVYSIIDPQTRNRCVVAIAHKIGPAYPLSL